MINNVKKFINNAHIREEYCVIDNEDGTVTLRVYWYDDGYECNQDTVAETVSNLVYKMKDNFTLEVEECDLENWYDIIIGSD